MIILRLSVSVVSGPLSSSSSSSGVTLLSGSFGFTTTSIVVVSLTGGAVVVSSLTLVEPLFAPFLTEPLTEEKMLW